MRELDKILDDKEKVYWEGTPKFWPFFLGSSIVTTIFGLFWMMFLLPFLGIAIYNIFLGNPLIGFGIMLMPHFWIGLIFVFGVPIYQLLLYKQFYSKQFDTPMDKIDVEYFIVKRKLYENVDWPQKRVQSFVPANGTPSINKVVKNLSDFLDDGFDGGEHKHKDYLKNASKKTCRFCEFNQTEYCDEGIK